MRFENSYYICDLTLRLFYGFYSKVIIQPIKTTFLSGFSVDICAMKKYIWIPIVLGAVYLTRKALALKQVAEQFQFRTTGVRLLTTPQGLTLRIFIEVQNPSTQSVTLSKISGSVAVNRDIIGFFDVPNVKLNAGANPLTIDVKLDSGMLATLGLTNIADIFTGKFKLPSVTVNTTINMGVASSSSSQTFKI
jgi:hypothetical protein